MNTVLRSRPGREGELTPRDRRRPQDEPAISGAGTHDGIDNCLEIALAEVLMAWYNSVFREVDFGDCSGCQRFIRNN